MYIYNDAIVIYNNKKESVAAICNKMDESHKHIIEQQQKQMYNYDSIYLNFKNRQKSDECLSLGGIL